MTWRKREIADQVAGDIGGDETAPSIENKPLEVVFMPGCFDAFEGTQEELAELIALIQSKVADGSIITESIPVEPDDELAQEFYDRIEAATNRTLN